MSFAFEDAPKARRDLPKLERGVPFLLAHPGGWSVYEGRILPSLVRYSLRGGLHRCLDADLRTTDGKSNPYPGIDKVVSLMRKRDHTYLPWDDRLAGQTYIESHEVAGGGRAYLCAWETPIPGSTRTKLDVELYARWVSHWQSRGLIPETPPEAIVAERRSSARRVLDRARERPQGDKTERFRAATDTLKAWDRVAAPAERKTKKRSADNPFADQDDPISTPGTAGFGD